MASKTDILNRGVIKLGGSRVSNFDTTNNNTARTLNEIYETVRDTVLQSYPWNFAIKREALAADPDEPVYGYDAKYALPSDCLALLDLEDDPDYQIEGGYILIDHTGELNIRYISRITNTGAFHAMFIDVFSCRLAYEACERITQSNTKKDILYKEYQVAVAAAYAADAIETPAELIAEDEWLEARV